MSVRRVRLRDLGSYAAAEWTLLEFQRFGRGWFAVVCKRSYRVGGVHC